MGYRLEKRLEGGKGGSRRASWEPLQPRKVREDGLMGVMAGVAAATQVREDS